MRFVLTGSGHIAGVVNPPARQKYQYWIGRRAEGHARRLDGARPRSMPGSWWDDWQAWLEGIDRHADEEEAPARRRQAEADRGRPGLREVRYVMAHGVKARPAIPPDMLAHLADL